MPINIWPIRRIAVPRIPLPVKVFLSYLLVVFVGALPAYLYLRQLFITEFVNDAVKRLAGRTQLLANALSNQEVHDRIDDLHHIGPTFLEGITYITSTGRVLFDSTLSDTRSSPNELARPEIQRALGRMSADEAFEFTVPHMGVARRLTEAQVDTLFIAVRIVNDAGTGNDLLRLAMPIAEVEQLSTLMVRVFRNSQAAAVSIALLLSLLAAISFMRPLQQLAGVASALATGDYTTKAQAMGSDEIGDVGRALNQLGQELRKRLAVAEAGEAMMVQLVHSIHLPMAIFGPEDRIVAINGAARDAFNRQQSHAEASFLTFVKSASFRAAVKEAEARSEPTHIAYTPDDSGVSVSGWVHILRQPVSPPFRVFLGEDAVRRPQVYLPHLHDFTAVDLNTTYWQAHQRAEVFLARSQVTLAAPTVKLDVFLSDAQDRLSLALFTAFCGIIAGVKGPVSVNFIEKPTRLAVVINASVTDAAAEVVEFLLNPIGGRVKTSAQSFTLLLAKA